MNFLVSRNCCLSYGLVERCPLRQTAANNQQPLPLLHSLSLSLSLPLRTSSDSLFCIKQRRSRMKLVRYVLLPSTRAASSTSRCDDLKRLPATTGHQAETRRNDAHLAHAWFGLRAVWLAGLKTLGWNDQETDQHSFSYFLRLLLVCPFNSTALHPTSIGHKHQLGIPL